MTGRGQSVVVSMRDSFDKSVQAEFPKIVTKLVEGVIRRLDLELVQKHAMDPGRGPRSEISAGFLQEEFDEAHETGVFQFDASDFGVVLNDGLA